MLPLAVIEEVQQLLAEGQLSQRKIALQTGVSRGTVGAISRGNRGIYGREPLPGDSWLPDLEIPPERCRACGGMVHKPCLLCQARAYRLRKKRLAELGVTETCHPRLVA